MEIDEGSTKPVDEESSFFNEPSRDYNKVSKDFSLNFGSNEEIVKFITFIIFNFYVAFVFYICKGIRISKNISYNFLEYFFY